MTIEFIEHYGSTATSEVIRLHHGTDLTSAHWIASYGLSLEKLELVQGAWAFWTTLDQKIACGYAHINPARGIPALLSFDVPTITLNAIFQKDPPWTIEVIEDKAVAFLPVSFSVVNSAMTNFSVQEVTSVTLTFD